MIALIEFLASGSALLAIELAYIITRWRSVAAVHVEVTEDARWQRPDPFRL